MKEVCHRRHGTSRARQNPGGRKVLFMPKKVQTPYREYEAELARQIREQDFKPVYLVCGEQDFLRTQNVKRLQVAILGDGDAMNSTLLKGPDIFRGAARDYAGRDGLSEKSRRGAGEALRIPHENAADHASDFRRDFSQCHV